jgi:hypothetical protein
MKTETQFIKVPKNLIEEIFQQVADLEKTLQDSQTEINRGAKNASITA